MSDPSAELNPERADASDDMTTGSDTVELVRAQVVDAGIGGAEQIGAELAAVDRALARIEAGAYGNCTDCGARLDDALLATDATAMTCPAHLGLEHTSEPTTAEGQPVATTAASWGSDR